MIPGIVAVVRDEALRVTWCTPSYGKIAGNNSSSEEMTGTTVGDILPTRAAQERMDVHRKVMDTLQVESHYRLIDDSRVLCTIFPLDEEAFGHRGVLVIVQDAPINARVEGDQVIPVLATPNLVELHSLSNRELEVLYFVATGMSTLEIAERINRANKTVEHHINSIHGKLGTHSRAQLVRFASERGIQSFSDEEWASIVQGARLVRKEGLQAKSETEIKPSTKTEVESD